jgi:hypothetical protein
MRVLLFTTSPAGPSSAPEADAGDSGATGADCDPTRPRVQRIDIDADEPDAGT